MNLKIIGGPLDGMEVPNSGYFKEGDIEAVDTLEYCLPGAEWSPESVYRVKGATLVYDPESTAHRREITRNNPNA